MQRGESPSRVELLKHAHLNLKHLNFRKSITALTIFTDPHVESDPIVIRKAKALALYLDEMSPLIMENELIVGSQILFGLPGASPFSLTNQEERFRKLRYLDSDDIGGAAGMGGPDSRPEPGREIPTSSSYTRIFPEYYTEQELEDAERVGLSRYGLTTGHNVPGYRRVLSLGYRGIREEALTRIRELQKEKEYDSKQIAFLQAVVIVMEAASRYLMKLASEAEALASETLAVERKKELDKIAAVCHALSEKPPQTFHEALQLFWTTHMITKIMQGCIYLGRFDQYLYPFLQKDLSTGRLSKNEAQDLLECAWIKLNEGNHLSQNSCCNLMLSGQDSAGKDATNELTYMCLEAYAHLGLADPKVNVRIHKKAPPELMRRCSELIRKGGSFPALYNDEVIIPTLLTIGISLEDARDYCMDGCQEITIGGKSDFYPVFAPQINFLKLVLQVLDDDSNFNNFTELLDAYTEAVAAAIQRSVLIANQRDAALSRIAPCPFLSATIEGCIEKARDKTEGGCKYNYSGMIGATFASGINALAALKKAVFDDQRVSMTILKEALAKNFEGYERLRQYLLNCPKYGNDDDYVDSIGVQVGKMFIQETLKWRNPRGGIYVPGFFIWGQVHQGEFIPATPDGRRARESVSAHISPVPGTDKQGPLALMRSAVKICRLAPPLGTALDVKLHPSALVGKTGLEKLMVLIQGFMDLGGLTLQINVVDAQTLREAQLYPEKHRGLLVRVWGFSAYFIRLVPEYQEEIIARTEHLI